MTYRITVKSILIQLMGVGVIIIMALIGIGYLIYFRSALPMDAISLMFGLALIFSLDSIVLFVKYFISNRDVVIEIVSNSEIRWQQGGKSFCITPADVEVIELNLTYPIFDGRIGWGGGDNFIFAKFILKNNRSLLLTSLVSPKLEIPKPFFDKVIRIRKFRCWP